MLADLSTFFLVVPIASIPPTTVVLAWRSPSKVCLSDRC